MGHGNAVCAVGRRRAEYGPELGLADSERERAAELPGESVGKPSLAVGVPGWLIALLFPIYVRCIEHASWYKRYQGFYHWATELSTDDIDMISGR